MRAVGVFTDAALLPLGSADICHSLSREYISIPHIHIYISIQGDIEQH